MGKKSYFIQLVGYDLAKKNKQTGSNKNEKGGKKSLNNQEKIFFYQRPKGIQILQVSIKNSDH